ncbi:MAG TPA: protein kinase, partial [Polyangia bacterium]|nr:protein kinase [Polyangia bacterium]
HSAALVGQTIAGKFVIETVIAVGGIGTVYRAHQLGLDRKVALKLLQEEFAQDEDFIERFKREARAASRLDHPNSVRVLDFGQHEGSLYLAMEYVEGRTLFEVIQADFPLPEERTVDILSQVLAAVGVAHDMGVVHRDLKPENIMIIRATSDEGEHHELVKVLDFGIASLGTVARAPDAEPEGPRMTKRGLVVGTPEYMAPEQAGGERPDRRSDIYSLGVVLYQMLAKRLPFQGDSALTVAVKHITEPPPLPSQFAAVSQKIEAVCLRALSKAPEDRYPNAREMRTALRSAINIAPGRSSSPQSVFAGGGNDNHTGSLMGAIADVPHRRHTPLVVGLTLATLFAAALGVRSLVRARRSAAPPVERTSATSTWPASTPASGLPAHAARPGLDPAPDPTGPTAGALPAGAPVPDDVKPASGAPPRRSKAALVRESRDRSKRGARGGRATRAGAPVAVATGAGKPAPGRAAAGDRRTPPADLAAGKSALTATPPAPPPAPLDISRAGVSIAAISSTSAIPSSNIRAGLSRAPLLHCYREALRAAGAAATGTAVLHLKIDIAGYVTSTQLEGAHFLPGVKACVEQAARGARIKDVDTGEGSADITLNFTYSP